MSNTRTSNYFTIDFLSKKIIGSSASFKKAGMGTGAWYVELVAKMNAHPDFELKEVNVESDKEVYRGLNIDFMKDYIALQNNSEVLLMKLEQIQECAKKVTNSVYPIVKKWFLNEFKDFDMEKARNAIKESKDAKIYAEAENNVAKGASKKAESAEVEDANGLPLRRS